MTVNGARREWTVILEGGECDVCQSPATASAPVVDFLFGQICQPCLVDATGAAAMVITVPR